MLNTVAEVSEMIRAGRRLLLAGEEGTLRRLPQGEWIGGTIPYFMTHGGGLVSREGIFVTEVPPEVTSTRIVTHDAESLSGIAQEAPENGFTFLVLPAYSPVHLSYAHDAPDYPQMYLKPIVGWIAGVHLEDLGRTLPKVVDGRTGQFSEDLAVAMHCHLPAGIEAHLGIVNLFRQGGGDRITFPSDGFQATECWVNGKKRSFAAYLAEKHIDTRLPLVANYSGAMINVSFQTVDLPQGRVDFYAPVFQGVAYEMALPVTDYVSEFRAAVPSRIVPAFSCNCILNFVHSELEGKVTAGMFGPVTFGEIAYQLLNQTLVYLTLDRTS